jgi:signal peptidase I
MKRRSLIRVFAGALGLLIVAAGWLFLGPTQLGGSTSYAVIVGTSMEPMLHRGDLAVVREESTYRPGDVVLYQARELGSNVLHRIVRVQDGRFVLKGDNNDFLDSEQPTEAEIVGKLWLSAPQVGGATEWLHTPSHAALLVGLATLLALGGGAGLGATRRRRGTPEVARPERAGPPKSASAGDPLPLLGAVGVASVLFAVLAILAFTRPVTVTQPVADAYVHQGRFEYSASVRRNEVYPDGRVTTGEPIFLRLVPALRVSFGYQLEARQRVVASGRVRLDARVSDGRGWERHLPLAPERSFRGDHVSVGGTVDLRAVESLVDEVRRLTGSAEADYTMTLLPRVTLTGHAGRDPIDATFAPELPFDLGDLRLQPNLRGSGQGVGPFAPRETASGTHVAAGQLELGPLSLPVRTARPLSLIGLVASLLLGALALAALLQRHRGEEHERIAARYGHLLLPVRSRPQEWTRVTDLADIGSLVRVAEQYDRMIFHVNDGGEHSYLVESEGSVLRYRTKPAPIHTGSPPLPSLRVDDTEAVQAALPALVPGGQVAKRHRPRRRFSRRRDSEDW